MLEAKYFKDYKHNYLILKCEGAGEGENYQRNMLASNKIERILNCSVRNINGEAYFYYDISSKVTLENFYRNKKMTYEELKDFFEQIDMIYRNLGEFFMDEAGLLICPEYLYYDISSGKYFGLYYPCGEECSETPYEPLTDFLLNHVDTGDKKLVDIIYKIYEMSEEPYFLTSDVLPLFEEEDAIVVENVEGCLSGQRNIPEDDYSYFPERIEEDDETEEIGAEIPMTESEGGKKDRSPQNKSRLFYGIFAFLSLCGIAGTGGIYFAFELTQKELMMVICCLVATGLCFLFSIVQVFVSGSRAQKKEEEERELVRDIENEFREEEAVLLQNVLDKNMDLSVAGSGIVQPQTRSMGRQADKRAGSREENQSGLELRYGETVFIDTKWKQAEYKLYATDKRNKKHIELTRFPFTIGKMAGCVDCVLADDSISRLHARIERKEEKIFLTDMNSTNGTYKNGLRMEPSETVEIEVGDEIRFGKLNYCYR